MKPAKKKCNDSKVRPGEEWEYMSPIKSNQSEERAFRNSLALKKTFQKKLNRENAVAKKEKVF